MRLYVSLLFLIFGLPSYGQTSSPSVGIWETYSAPYVCTNGALNCVAFNLSNGPGSIPDTAVKGRVTALSSSHITIELEKQTGTSYFQNGETWGTSNINNPNGLCGSIKNDYQTISSTPTKITLNFAHGLTAGGNGYFYAVYRNSITGKYYYVGNFYITIPVVSASLSGSFTGISGLWQYNKPSYITSQVSCNNGVFNGNVRIGWYDGTGNYVTYLLDSSVNNLQNGQTKNINFTTNSIKSKAGNYIAKLEYRSFGSTTYTVLDSKSITIIPGNNCPSFAVPFSVQDFNTEQCGQNCVRMCLGYFAGGSMQYSVSDICNTMGNPNASSPTEQATAFNKLSLSMYSAYAGKYTFEDLKNDLCNSVPVIIRVRTSMSTTTIPHFMVALGIDDDYIYVNNPGKTMGENKSYPIQDFLNSWPSTGNNVVHFVHDKGAGTSIDNINSVSSLLTIYPNPSTGIISILSHRTNINTPLQLNIYTGSKPVSPQ